MSFKLLNLEEINTKLLELCPEQAELYLVGGYIRDIIVGRECFDKDYAIKGFSAMEFARKVAEEIGGYYVPLDEKHDIARVVMPDKKNTLDFAKCVGDDIYSDLKNRDYTINAIACKLEENKCEVIDPFSGIEDIERKEIRAISEQNLIDDPLRVLRAFRLSSQFKFLIEPETLQIIQRHKKLINKVAAERVTTELIKLFEADHSALNLLLMKDTGVLFEIFPEMQGQLKIPPNLHHHLPLIEHSIEVVSQVEQEIRKLPGWAGEHLYRDFSTGIKYISFLKLAALLHDLGKPETWQIDDEGRHRFIKHEDIGSEQAVSVLKRLKFSNNSIKYICFLIKNHLYPSQLLAEGVENLSEKAMMRFFRRAIDYTPDLLLIAMADRLSARGPEITDEMLKNNLEGLYYLLEKYRESKEEVKSLPKLLNGQEIMEVLNIPKGPKVGKVVRALKEAQVSGDVNTREEALEFIKQVDTD